MSLHKLIAWSQQFGIVINIKSVGCKLLQLVTGILEIVTVVVLIGDHFMNNIRSLGIKSGKTHHAVHIPNLEEKIKIALKGVRINLLTFRLPNHIIIVC